MRIVANPISRRLIFQPLRLRPLHSLIVAELAKKKRTRKRTRKKRKRKRKKRMRKRKK